jgi:hypothetical protein
LGFNTDKIYTYNKGDELYTPSNAIIPLIKYLSKELIIWECAEKESEDGNITKTLRENGYQVITTSIHNGYDFLNCKVPEEINCIITNPPFSLKNEFLKRCYDLKLPFALLLPIQALDTKQRFEYYSKYGLDLMIFDKRVNYIGSNGSPPFASAWFTNKILPDKLVFEILPKSTI